MQRYGIQFDRIRYWNDVLRAWVGARDPKNKTRKRLFWVKRDPRDIKFVYFFDPQLKSYHRIPCRDTSLPSVSLFEFRRADAMVRSEGKRHVNVTQIAKAIGQMDELQRSEGKKTKSLRKAQERRRTTPTIHEEIPLMKMIAAPARFASTSQSATALAEPTVIEPFAGSED